MSPTPAEVEARLRDVFDPCSIAMGAPIDIWTMGLVDQVAVDGGRVTVCLVLTDVSCVFFREIRRHVTDSVGRLPGVEDIDVELDATMLWTPDRMRDRAPVRENA